MSLAAPLQPLRCTNPSCQLPTGGRCARGAEFADPLAACPDLGRVEGAAGPGAPAPPPLGGVLAVPWTGGHLSVAEGLALSRGALTRVVSVVGASDAGKTSLLTSFFLQLANGAFDGFPWRVAGSRSLRSFEDLVEAVRAYGGAAGEQSTPHTPRVEGDAETFLHLALLPLPERAPDAAGALRADGVVREVVLSDVNGELFSELAAYDAPETRARLRYLQHSDLVFVLVDAAALRGRSGARADRDGAAMLQRTAALLAEAGRGAVLRLVFTKCDQLGADFDAAQGAVDAAWVKRTLRAPRLLAQIDELVASGALRGLHAVTAFPGPLVSGHPGGLTRLFGAALAALERAPAPVPEANGAGGALRIQRWDR